MDSCKISEKDILLIQDVVLEMLQRGELQHGLYNCDGQSLGKGASVITCCPGCGDTPPSGPDNDTKNARMIWEVVAQRLSLIDTAGGKVEADIHPSVLPGPPANEELVIKNYTGRSKSVIMGQPIKWMRVTLPDGRVGKTPVYS